ncbi:Sec-independent protein translocase protein TatB [Pseudooceanicola aestuarii]|uniref:Sec-independent protein translocase protein TatB n=1 Tax=Pseudooceanicola aestuarii TaxID=2697319 RepID=UPI0030844655
MGWTELLLIGIVALVVVGPKELPGLFRNIGQFVGKARGMAREFSRAMEEAADEAGVKEAGETLRGLANPKQYGLDKVKDATDFARWDPDSETGKLASERAEAAKKIREATAERAEKRKAEEASATAAENDTGAPSVTQSPAVKSEGDTPEMAKAKPAKPKPAAGSTTKAAKPAKADATATPDNTRKDTTG